MAAEGFPRVLRGYDVSVVDEHIDRLEGEIETLREELFRVRAQLSESLDTNTNLRLTVIKQVEEASAEAAVVLGHARSEATRIRELAVADSDSVMEQAHQTRDELVEEARSLREAALAERDAQKASADDIISRARKDAADIVADAQVRADSLIDDAEASQQESQKRVREMENDLRLQKLELDRIESDTREKAEAYAMRVYREADEYAKSSERRALDLEKQAAEILQAARVNAHDQTTRSLQTARRYLEEALGLVNGIFSDVNGSLLEVQRIRQILGDSVDRIAQTELSQPSTPVLVEVSKEDVIDSDDEDA